MMLGRPTLSLQAMNGPRFAPGQLLGS